LLACGSDGRRVRNQSIITGEPNSLVADLHDRTPIVLDPADYDSWLRGGDQAALQTMLQPFPAQLMTAFPVSSKVNSVKNDTPDVIEPLRPAEPDASLF